MKSGNDKDIPKVIHIFLEESNTSVNKNIENEVVVLNNSLLLQVES